MMEPNLDPGANGEPPLDEEAPRRMRRTRTLRQVGEPIVIGHEPKLVRITVDSGTALREIQTYMLTMAEVVEVIQEAIRRRIEQPHARR